MREQLGRFFRIVWNWLQRDKEETRWTCEENDRVETYWRLKRQRESREGW